MKGGKFVSSIAWLSIAFVSLSVEVNAPARAETCEGTFTEMRACASNLYKKADDELNAVWQSLPESLKRKLRQQQRDWIKYRDSYCDAEAKSFFEGGRDEILVQLACKADETKKQTQKLRTLKEQLR